MKKSRIYMLVVLLISLTAFACKESSTTDRTGNTSAPSVDVCSSPDVEAPTVPDTPPEQLLDQIAIGTPINLVEKKIGAPSSVIPSDDGAEARIYAFSRPTSYERVEVVGVMLGVQEGKVINVNPITGHQGRPVLPKPENR